MSAFKKTAFGVVADLPDELDFADFPKPNIEFSGKFEWLTREGMLDKSYLRNNPDDRPRDYWQDGLAIVVGQAKAQELTLPQGYELLFKTADLRKRFRSPIGEAFVLPGKGLVDIPDRKGEKLLEFYTDAEGDWHWYIHWDESGASTVVGSHFDYYDGYDYAEFNEAVETADGSDITCATDVIEEYEEHFERFMFQLWVSQEEWFGAELEQKTSKLASNYAAKLQKFAAPAAE